ncbi:hypothetical protein INT47_007451 [Mucor saturninus]|uniref:Uncharacterized protein n=1 Tax=Mucor saturninus TaxID=64648 RepID=A0A8H7QZB5_9FUNG|nr:hypothetical protein INT47_007451 [Mucor saturninus]
MNRPSNPSSGYSSLHIRANRSRSSSVLSVKDNIPQVDMISIAPINMAQLSSREMIQQQLVPWGALYNSLSAWIKTSIAKQKVRNLEWNLSKQFTTVEITRITKNIIDFVGAQILLSTKKNWTESITYNDLQTKIRNVFRRQQDNEKQSPAAKLLKNKKKKLLIEQLQSDEESPDSELGMTEKNPRLWVMVPHWQTDEARRAFEHFNEYDLILRKNAETKDAGRFKHVVIKPEFLN